MTRLLVLLAAAFLAVSGEALAQAGEGTTTIAFDAASGLRVAAAGGAVAFERRVALPVAAGRRGAADWRLGHRGTLTLRGRRVVRISRLELRVGRHTIVVGRVAGRRQRVFTTSAHARRNRGTGRVILRDAPVRLAPAMARRLGATRARIGRLTVDARLLAGSASRVTLPARPPGAVDVAAGSVSWHLRDSFVQYLNAGEGIRVSDGARAGEPTTRPGSDQLLVYDVDLPLRRGWHHPATGLTVLELGGAVALRYRAHGIDFAVRDAVVELGGSRPSRATFRFTGEAGDEFDGSRAPLVDLVPERARERTVQDGKTTLVEVPGRVPRAKTVFSGFYQPGDPFGWMTVSFTTRSP